MAKVDPRDFLFNTDYPLDKVILFREGEFTNTVDIPHGLDFIPLPFGVWSTDKDFTSVNTLGSVDTFPSPFYVPTVLSVDCVADASKIWLTSYGNTNNVKLYYRVYGFEPAGSRSHVPATSSAAKQFVLNTDYNYCKLFKEGEFTQPNEEFKHGLGYVPQVMVWISALGQVLPLMNFSEPFSGATSLRSGLTVTDQVIRANAYMGPEGIPFKYYWRIYYDEA